MQIGRHTSAFTKQQQRHFYIGCRNENTSDEDRTIVVPMDLSKSKSGSPSSVDAIPLNLGNKNPIITIPSPKMRPLSSSSRSSENIINNNTIITNINDNDISAKNHNFNNYKSDSPVNFSTRRSSPASLHQPPPKNSTVVSSSSPQPSSHNNNVTLQQNRRNSRKSDLRWRESSSVLHHHVSGDDDDNTTYSSPDSGLHRDSPGEEDEVSSNKPLSPSTMWRNLAAMSTSSAKYINNNNNNNSASGTPLLRKQTQQPSLIPLSLIRAKYNHTNVSPDRFSSWDEEHFSPEKHRSEGGGRGDQTKRARLEEMVSQIKTTKDPRTRHYSGDDDDMSSGGHVTSSDEVVDDGPTDLRNNVGYRGGRGGGDKRMMLMGGSGRKEVESDIVAMNLIKDEYNDEEEDDEPCNLTYPKSSSPRQDGLDISQWKKQEQFKNSSSPFPLSPTDAAKLYGIDPDTYQQQIRQLQLTSAAMLGDPGSLLKALGSYPPWVYMGYYSQLLQSFQAQEILRQYAIQSSNQSQSPPIQGEKISPINRSMPTLNNNNSNSNNNNYHSQSPVSPASVNEGNTGMDSDGSVVGQTTPNSASGKRAPRAMTGRHVRTGTGASPSTLLTLRQKIEERQRVKAQHARQEALLQSQGKANKNNNKYSRKPAKK